MCFFTRLNGFLTGFFFKIIVPRDLGFKIIFPIIILQILYHLLVIYPRFYRPNFESLGFGLIAQQSRFGF